jgi:hypothetical protein
MQQKLLPLQGAAQPAFEGLPFDAPDVHVLTEEMVFIAPLSLGVIHRGVRILDEGIRIVTVLGVDTDPNAGAQMNIMVGDGVRHRKRSEYLFRADGRISRFRDF